MHQQLCADPLFDPPAVPDLATVAFRLRRGDTSELLQRVNAEQRVFLSGTSIDGRYTGRICVLNHRTDRARVDEAIGALRRHAAAQRYGATEEPSRRNSERIVSAAGWPSVV